MKYLGYTITLDGGRYKGYTPNGSYFCSSNDVRSIRRLIREHQAAGKTKARDVPA